MTVNLQQNLDVILNDTHFKKTRANCVWVPVKIGLPTPKLITSSSDRRTDKTSPLHTIWFTGCHGHTMFITEADYIVSSLHRAYDREYNKSSIKDTETYYEEMFPFFSEMLVTPYVKGDKHIVVDASKPGNFAMQTFIISRQPWEDLRFMPTYTHLRSKGVHPLIATWASQSVKYIAKNRLRDCFDSDHDVFTEVCSLALMADFATNGIRNLYQNKSLHEGYKSGVTAAFKGPITEDREYIVEGLSDLTRQHTYSVRGYGRTSIPEKAILNFLESSCERVLEKCSSKIQKVLRSYS